MQNAKTLVESGWLYLCLLLVTFHGDGRLADDVTNLLNFVELRIPAIDLQEVRVFGP